MPHTRSLFDDRPEAVEILPGWWYLPGFADSEALAPVVAAVCEQAPERRMQTPRGFTMSVATTSCGAVGWVSDRRGYRYSPVDPVTGTPWPAMPAALSALADSASRAAGFGPFAPDTCLINQYTPGTRMGAHQDRDEADFSRPIVSVSLGIPARFFIVGDRRQGRSVPVDLVDGDVVVFGGPARRQFHGVRPLKDARHPRFGAVRWNLTFRQARAGDGSGEGRADNAASRLG